MFALNIIALELACIMFLFCWIDEVGRFLLWLIFNIQVSWLIFITIILWILHAGNKHYTLMYTKGGEEDEVYEIDFPSIRKK